MKLSKFFLVLVFLLFPFGQLTKIPLGIPGVSLYLQDLVISLLIFCWIIYHFLKRKPFLKPPLFWPILGFIAVAVFSLFVNLPRLRIPEFIVSSLYLLRWSTYAGLYFVVYEIKEEKILNLLAAAGVTTAFFGLIQYIFYPNLRNLYYLGWDPHQYRVFGTFFDPGFTGIILLLTLILLLCSQTVEQSLATAGGSLVYLALALTYSRSSYLALASAMAVLTWFKKSAKFLLLPLLLFGFVIAVNFLSQPTGEGVRLERQSTIFARMENWRQGFKIICEHPFFGVGFNSLRFIKRDYGFLSEDWQKTHSGGGLDSSLLFVWATTGLVGLIVYLWMWWQAMKNLKLKMKNKKVKSNLYLCVLASTVALFCHSLFLNSFFYPWVMIWMWLVLGISHSRFWQKI